MANPTLLKPGDHGQAVHDLQARLGPAGHPLVLTGRYDDATTAAVRAFQAERGLRVDGICGPETWGALIESSYRLGDRLLYLRRPHLRGDDVMELQRRLNALGFDAGREDGILGPDTERAVRQFQRNAGIASDAICGPETRAALERLGALAAGSVASVREREHLRRGARLAGSRIFLAADPGLEPLAADVARELQARGAVVTVDACGADDGAVAAAANDAGADLFVAFAARGECTLQVAYFANPTFQSEGGRRVAAAVAAALHAVDSAVPDLPVGRTFRLLRETRMAAVVCELAEGGDDPSLAAVAGRRAEFAAAFVAGISRGIEAPKPG